MTETVALACWQAPDGRTVRAEGGRDPRSGWYVVRGPDGREITRVTTITALATIVDLATLTENFK